MKGSGARSSEKSGRDIESGIGLALRYGVLVSTLVIILGVLLSPFVIGSYQGCPATLDAICGTNIGRPDSSLSSLLAGVSVLNPVALIELGVVILLAIPFFRVAAGGVMFASERDWRYVAISAFVLLVLLVGTLIVGPYEAG